MIAAHRITTHHKKELIKYFNQAQFATFYNLLKNNITKERNYQKISIYKKIWLQTQFFNFQKKLDINKLVLIFSVFLQLCTQVHFQSLHKYTGSVHCSNINIFSINTVAHQFSPQHRFVECFRCTHFWKDTHTHTHNKIKRDRVKTKKKKKTISVENLTQITDDQKKQNDREII